MVKRKRWPLVSCVVCDGFVKSELCVGVFHEVGAVALSLLLWVPREKSALMLFQFVVFCCWVCF